MERNRSMGHDRSKDLELTNVKMYTFLIVLKHSSLSLGILNMYFSIDNVQKVFKRSRILGFAVGNEKNFPSPFKSTHSITLLDKKLIKRSSTFFFDYW